MHGVRYKVHLPCAGIYEDKKVINQIDVCIKLQVKILSFNIKK
jgi:hypothetical protein